MNKNSNPIANLSFRAIEAKARKAAAVAAAKAKEQSTKSKTPKKVIPAIEREISVIYKALSLHAPENEAVVLERPKKPFACRATISIYLRSDLLRQQEEQEARSNSAAAAAEASQRSKPFRALSKVTYAFYPATVSPDKLGSVAIYGSDPEATLDRIVSSGHLFGLPVKRASIETGRRAFVDVQLTA